MIGSTNVIADLSQFNVDDKGKFTYLRSEVSEYVCTGLTDYIYTHTPQTQEFFSFFSSLIRDIHGLDALHSR